MIVEGYIFYAFHYNMNTSFAQNRVPFFFRHNALVEGTKHHSLFPTTLILALIS